MTLSKYILNDSGVPVPEPNVMKWAAWMEDFDRRRVARDKVGEVEVSTVFLGLDHRFLGEGPPLLWETMVFGGPRHHEHQRCAGTREQAEAMHAEMLKVEHEAQEVTK